MHGSAEIKEIEPDKKSLFFGDSGSYTKVSNRLLSQGRHLTPQAKWLYVTLQSYWYHKTERIFPSYDKIEKRSGLTRPAISKALKELEHFRWLTKRRHFSKSTDYDLSYPEKNPPVIHEDETEDKEWFCCPTKQQATEWRKKQALKRNESGKRKQETKPWEKKTEDDQYYSDFGDEDIPF